MTALELMAACRRDNQEKARLEAQIEELDDYIRRYAHGWKPERISRTALAALRCAMCEVLYMDDVPDAAALNEAVELDKGYDEPETVAFVNGVLGGFMRAEFPKQDGQE